MIAVFVGRFQPFHNGHLKVVKWIIEKYGKILIVIGSIQENRTEKNPLTFEERKKMIKSVFLEKDIKNFKIVGVSDNIEDSLWIKNVLREIKEKDIIVYTMNSWTRECFEKAGINVCQHPLIEDLSATKVRRRIRKKQEWKSLLPSPLKNINIEKKII